MLTLVFRPGRLASFSFNVIDTYLKRIARSEPHEAQTEDGR